MKQVLQDLSKGDTLLEDVPCPKINRQSLLIESHCSLVSAGTERMLMNFGKAGIVGKIKQQPDKVRMVLDKAKTDGLVTTLEAVKAKLNEPLPLGYSNVGEVLNIGDGVSGYCIGDRVVSNGNHAEVVRVPKNLCAKVPDEVTSEEAAFTVVGAIALQGIRLVQPTLGEYVVVFGLGLIGLLTVQLLRANGCQVLGIDFDSKKLSLARQFGAETVDLGKGEDLIQAAEKFSKGPGVDAVLVTASTKSNDLMHQAATICRKRGRIVLVGVVGLKLSREDLYRKELSFQVSCSYGPGRYDVDYEDNGHDYPIGFVRWTEQRNLEAFLGMLKDGKVDVKPLITHHFDIDKTQEAYKVLEEEPNALGILLNYHSASRRTHEKYARTVAISPGLRSCHNKISVVGTGNYASRTLVPAFKKAGAVFKQAVSSAGLSAVILGRRQGFEEATTDFSRILEDEEVGAALIATRHDKHASQVIEALKHGKHVFVEKPLVLSAEELMQVDGQYRSIDENERPVLTVGFNRRFSPHILKAKSLLETIHFPVNIIMTINAGFVPDDHWIHDEVMGGGRLVGECCHFIDLGRHLVNKPIISYQITAMNAPGLKQRVNENFTITLSFEDGSMVTIHYFSTGPKKMPKERIEIITGGRSLVIDNFIRMHGAGWPGFSKLKLWRQDKGQVNLAKAFIKATAGGFAPIPYEEIYEVHRVCLELNDIIS